MHCVHMCCQVLCFVHTVMTCFQLFRGQRRCVFGTAEFCIGAPGGSGSTRPLVFFSPSLWCYPPPLSEVFLPYGCHPPWREPPPMSVPPGCYPLNQYSPLDVTPFSMCVTPLDEYFPTKLQMLPPWVLPSPTWGLSNWTLCPNIQQKNSPNRWHLNPKKAGKCMMFSKQLCLILNCQTSVVTKPSFTPIIFVLHRKSGKTERSFGIFAATLVELVA